MAGGPKVPPAFLHGIEIGIADKIISQQEAVA